MIILYVVITVLDVTPHENLGGDAETSRDTVTFSISAVELYDPHFSSENKGSISEGWQSHSTHYTFNIDEHNIYSSVQLNSIGSKPSGTHSGRSFTVAELT